MASKENQNLQIVVIVLTILVFILAGLSVWLNGKKNTAVVRAEGAVKQAQEAEKSERGVQAEANQYKLWMGFAEGDSKDVLEKQFATDMERFGATFPEDSRKYHTILESIYEENRQLARSEVEAKQQAKQLEQRLLAIETEHQEQIEEYRAQVQQAVAEKEQLKNQYGARRSEMLNTKNRIADQLGQLQERIDVLTAEHDRDEQGLQQEIKDLKRSIVILKANQLVPDPYAQPADGEIRYVDQREGKVWINLGRKDALRPQVTFSVYSGDHRVAGPATSPKGGPPSTARYPSEGTGSGPLVAGGRLGSNDADRLQRHTLNAAKRKGSLEVTRILGDHLAEARITSDQPSRPLMVGDKVYSQVWNRGRKVGFAIAGVVDLDDNGLDDLEQLKKVIEINDGTVDAFPDGAGSVSGKLSVDTRYLILGKYPEGARQDEDRARQSWNKLNSAADTLGVQTITLDEFLDLLGWQSGQRSVKLGVGARPEDFPARRASDALPQDANTQRSRFRPRHPPVAY